jgi:hypothetical protein
MAENNYIDHTPEEKSRLLNEIRTSAITISKFKTAKDRSYQGLAPSERASRYVSEVLFATPYGHEDKKLINFIEGKTDRITGYGISVLMAALGCSVQDILPSVKPSRDPAIRGAEAFQGIGSYWDAVQFVIS